MKNLEIKDLEVGDKIQASDNTVWEIIFIGNYMALARKEDGAEAAFVDGMLKFYKKVPNKHVKYVNVYPFTDNYGVGAAFSYESREEADKLSVAGRVACIRVEFEEGQFDD